MIVYDPARRITAKDALDHMFFYDLDAKYRRPFLDDSIHYWHGNWDYARIRTIAQFRQIYFLVLNKCETAVLNCGSCCMDSIPVWIAYRSKEDDEMDVNLLPLGMEVL